jgi:hypothetical protein
MDVSGKIAGEKRKVSVLEPLRIHGEALPFPLSKVPIGNGPF